MTRVIRFHETPDDGSACCFILLAMEHGVQAQGAGGVFTVTGNDASVEAFMDDMTSEFAGEMEVVD